MTSHSHDPQGVSTDTTLAEHLKQFFFFPECHREVASGCSKGHKFGVEK